MSEHASGGQKRASDLQAQAIVSCLRWVPESELGSSARPVLSLNC